MMVNLTRMTTANLIKRMERAGDFNYDDESVELNRRLEGTGHAWRWSKDFFNPHVVVYAVPTENLHRDDCGYMQDPDSGCTCGASH